MCVGVCGCECVCFCSLFMIYAHVMLIPRNKTFKSKPELHTNDKVKSVSAQNSAQGLLYT